MRRLDTRLLGEMLGFERARVRSPDSDGAHLQGIRRTDAKAYACVMTADPARRSTGAESLGTSHEPTTFEYVRLLRVRSGLNVEEVAHRAGVTSEWLEQFEAGSILEGVNYDELLALVRATEPERPEWWDSGHEHDLHLPSSAVRSRERYPDYWERIDQVRDSNRRARA